MLKQLKFNKQDRIEKANKGEGTEMTLIRASTLVCNLSL